ncbi:type II secretion system protein [Sulfuricurvum sp.]|jgi:general secretion pathway protein G|uniref:type II secretion system protein n=1 Tax=Sulfuricurvum sp. TaxID=2025608 RepID=UPI0025E95372|nr:type II secretion system protein [Sulfuricurvum sp.]
MLDYKRNGFTMIELVFVIVVIGILAAIAIPKFAATRDDAQMAKGRSDIAAIRSAIVSERQTRLMRGQTNYITKLDHMSGATATSGLLFDDNDTVTTNGTLLQYGIEAAAGNGHWTKTSATTYVYRVINVDNTFTYNSTDGTFKCTNGTYCSDLTN